MAPSKRSRRSSDYPKQWSEWVVGTREEYRAREIAKDQFEHQTRPLGGASLSPLTLSSDPATGQDGDAEYANQDAYTTTPNDLVGSLTQGLAGVALDDNTAESNDPPARAHVSTENSAEPAERLDPNYKEHHASEFQLGRIFKILWSEPQGSGGGTQVTALQGPYGEKIHTKVRRFVIVRKRKGHCICLPIMSYGNKGTNKAGVSAQDHAIIYTSKEPIWLPNESGMTKNPIKMKPNNVRHKLDSSSRLDYTKVYTVEYNVKVYFIGRIHPDSEMHFTTAFNQSNPPMQGLGSTHNQAPLGASYNMASSSTYPASYAQNPRTTPTSEHYYNSGASALSGSQNLQSLNQSTVAFSSWAQPNQSQFHQPTPDPNIDQSLNPYYGQHNTYNTFYQ